MNPIILNWAKIETRKAVALELRTKEKTARVTRERIIEKAEAHLKAHPELLERAAEAVRNSPTLRAMAERADRASFARAENLKS